MSPQLANRIIFILSLAGVFVSGYLTISHYKLVDLPCLRNAVINCEVVQTSKYGDGLGIPFLSAIPTAAFGLAAYILLVALSFIRTGGSERAAGTAAMLQFILASIGLLVSGWLSYLEANVIHAWCQWCLASAAITVLIFLTALAERLPHRPDRSAPMGEAA